jgi:SAM-dependent methyltransferase
MNPDHPSLIEGQALRLDLLMPYGEKPPLFAPGEPLFWDDPHISQQLLEMHLNPGVEAASRQPEVIERSVRWLVNYLRLKPGDVVLDLGCGPGLYCTRLSEYGLQVTGIDYSRRSIDYAVRTAAEQKLSIEYRYQNYLDWEEDKKYDVILLIYGDFCVLSPEDRRKLLTNVRRALKTGGCFVFDVMTRQFRGLPRPSNSWTIAASDFWRATPHLVLEREFDYPEDNVHLDQYIVIDADGRFTVYRNWYQYYSLETITPVLEDRGFTVLAAWSDLAGTPYNIYSEWIGLVAQKASGF